MASDEEFHFGENIDKSLFEDSLVQTVQTCKKRGKSVYDLQAAKNEMSPETDKYVFITIYRSHASIVVVDKELFDTLLFTPIFGQMIDGPSLTIRQHETAQRLANEVPLQQYHVCLDGDRYILARNYYYINWFLKSRSFFVGETALNYFYLQFLCLMVVPEKYRLVMDDCLEFAKKFALEVAVKENQVRVTEMQALYRTLKVSENFSTGAMEQISRNNPSSGFTAALSYFMSFRPERVLILVIPAAIAMLSYRLYRKS
uniref:Uncharacterized protein n=1 Tax=Amphimedon queenslandica TaxID=400682 RepID=A0A1X7V276_AMPQE